MLTFHNLSTDEKLIMKFDTMKFHYTWWHKFWLKQKITHTSCEDQHDFLCTSHVSLTEYLSKQENISNKSCKEKVMSNIYFLSVLHYSIQELLHCLIVQEIRGSNRQNVLNSIMFTFPFSYPPGSTSATLYTEWSNCVYVTGGSTPRLAYISSQKYPLNLHLWVPNRNTYVVRQ